MEQHGVVFIASQLFIGIILTFITVTITWLVVGRRMEKKYQTLVDQRIYEAAQHIMSKVVEDKMDTLQRRIICQNLIAMRICREVKIAEEEIRQIRSAVDLNNK